VTAGVRIDGGKATVEKLESRGGDAEITTQDVYAVLQPRLETSPLAGRAKVKVQDAFWSRTTNPGLKSLADAALASARGRDGAWSFQLAGTLTKPLLRPAPPSP
jgi:type II secretion system protein N